MAVQSWTFTQKDAAPGKLPKTITLEGPNCPFGRPRQKEVVGDGSELRQHKVYYPGNNVPTRHIFGTKWNDWQLNGRWRDNILGQDGANDLAQQFQDLLDDARPLVVSWGSIVSVDCWLDKFTPKRESAGEIVWEMTLSIDTPHNKSFVVIPNKPRAAALTADLEATLLGVDANISNIKKNPGINTDFLDSLDDLISSVNSFGASILHAVQDLQIFESNVAQEINRFRAGLHQLRTAMLTLRNTIFTAGEDATRTVNNADNDINWFTVTRAADVNTTKVLAILEDLDRESEIRIRSIENVSYTAKAGDSWESISNMFYGGPENSDAIRKANGIKYGGLPQAGKTYVIPRI